MFTINGIQQSKAKEFLIDHVFPCMDCLSWQELALKLRQFNLNLEADAKLTMRHVEAVNEFIKRQIDFDGGMINELFEPVSKVHEFFSKRRYL